MSMDENPEAVTSHQWLKTTTGSTQSEVDLSPTAFVEINSATSDDVITIPTIDVGFSFDVDPESVRKSERIRRHPKPSRTDKQSQMFKIGIAKKRGKNTQLIRRRKNLIRTPSSTLKVPFCCDKCKSPYVVNPLRRTGKKIKKKPTPRHKIDPVTRKLLTLCNACGLSINSSPTKEKTKVLASVSLEEKERYQREGKEFAASLSSALNDHDTSKLFCPHFKKSGGCGCLQKFIKGDGDPEELKKRASHLLQLHGEARRLSQQKCYNADVTKPTGESGRGKRLSSIGLGNGQKKSRMFEEFVLENRHYLRKNLHLCEKAAQHLLIYSNNFLHKRLKTEPHRGPRVPRQKGKAALGLLVSIDELRNQHCCNDKCVSMSVTHSHLLETWRERAISGQAEARRVLAEMLTPCGGARTNCYKFISLVTGCSHGTICSVSEQMRRTGGNREPPEHGLKKWWKEHPRPKNAAESGDELIEEDHEDSLRVISLSPLNGTNVSTANGLSDTELQLQITRQQVAQLQRQVEQQQLQIQMQQQQLLEQQIIAPQIVQLQQTLQQLLQEPSATISTSSNVSPDCGSTMILPKNTNSLSPSVKMESLQIPSRTDVLISQSLPILSMDEDGSRISNKANDLKSHAKPTEILNNEYSTNTLPSVNITILQQPVNTSNVSDGLQPSHSSMGNLVLIDPSLLISGSIAEAPTRSIVDQPETSLNSWHENE